MGKKVENRNGGPACGGVQGFTTRWDRWMRSAREVMDLLVGEGRCGISSQREAKANDWVTHHHHPQRLHLRTKSWERRGGHCHELVEMKKTKTALQEELLDMMPKRERTIKRLQTELNLMENKSRTNKKTLQERMGWSGEEINFADSINTFVQVFLFPRYKFLREGWQDYQLDKKNSLSSLCIVLA